MKLRDIVTPEEFEAVLSEDYATHSRHREHVERQASLVDQEYITIIAKYLKDIHQAAGVYRCLAYIAYALEKKEIKL